MEVGTQVKRMTISRDGRFAAFLTPSKADVVRQPWLRRGLPLRRRSGNAGLRVLPPEGPPTKNVTVSQGGKFMADDGRTFFATKDSLVPRDKNGDVTDVYEYIGGRPQLISGALASRDFTGESEVARPVRETGDHRPRGGQPATAPTSSSRRSRRSSMKTTTAST